MWGTKKNKRKKKMKKYLVVIVIGILMGLGIGSYLFKTPEWMDKIIMNLSEARDLMDQNLPKEEKDE
jgi:uncharacterized membrane-anchored protein YitT (DUF2179 family)